MVAVLRYVLICVVAWLLLAGVCLAKQVYLKDGAVVECESFWRRGDQVMVKVNRDIILDFEASEVDGKRTFTVARKRLKSPVVKKSTGKVTTHLAAAEAAVPDSVVTMKQKAENAAISAPVLQPTVAQAPPPAPGNPTVSTTPAPNAGSVKEASMPEETQLAPVSSSSPPDKEEMERKHREAADMMAEAVEKKDPELLKKAIEAQQNAMPQQQAQTAAGAMKILLILAVCALLIIASTWVVFTKAGQPGWHSIIPIYNMYVMMEISGKPWWWMFLLFIPVVGFIIYLLAMLSLAQRFGRGVVYGLGLFFLPMFFFPMLAFGGAQYER